MEKHAIEPMERVASTMDDMERDARNTENMEEITRTEVGTGMANNTTENIDEMTSIKENMEKKYGYRLVHLDLKGAIPKLDYLEKILPMMTSWGASGILLEVEDAFPYTGGLSMLKSCNAFSRQEMVEFGNICKRNELEVIPLVQTFGHLEFVLKHNPFRHLREVENYPNVLCPLNEDSPRVIMSLVEQVMDLHPDAKFLHIGGDEVWYLGKCERCKEEMEMKSLKPFELFLRWMSRIAYLIKRKYPNLSLIMWDDMIREVSVDKLNEYNFGRHIEPMIWHYRNQSGTQCLPVGLFARYSQIFERVWGASCFKGASGCAQFMPPISYHVQNQESWVQLTIFIRSMINNFGGIALTGWQRYDHYAVLCELLPASIPSLAMCLRVLREGVFITETIEAVSKELGFTRPINIFSPGSQTGTIDVDMKFPGHKIYSAMQTWSNLKDFYHAIAISDSMVGWFSDYFRLKFFTNPSHVEPLLQQCSQLETELRKFATQINECFEEVYSKETADEWVGTFIHPVLKRIMMLVKDCNDQLDRGGRGLNRSLNLGESAMQ